LLASGIEWRINVDQLDRGFGKAAQNR